jgi:hypothetical protein
MALSLLILTACTNGRVESGDVLGSNGIDRSIQVSGQASINEPVNCPSPVIYPSLLKGIQNAMLDESNMYKFDGWDSSLRAKGKEVEVIWSYEGTYYKLYWNDKTYISRLNYISIWERTDQPFILGDSDDDDAIINSMAYTDHAQTGCTNFGFVGSKGGGKDNRQMNWNDLNDVDQGLQYHEEWQEQYRRAMKGLGLRLEVY